MDVDFVFGRPLWAIIDVEEGRIDCYGKTRKECVRTIGLLRFGDMLDGKKKKYIIEREDRI